MRGGRFYGRRAILVSKHGKEQAIGPALAELGVELEVANVDTDRFGTFTGEVERTGSALDAARARIATGIATCGGDLFVASEGSFGPHPVHGHRACDHELVLLHDCQDDLEISGEHLTDDTNHGSHVLRRGDDPRPVAARIGLPTHAALVRAGGTCVAKAIFDDTRLREVLTAAFAEWKEVVVEAELRAMCNPRRMRAIASASRAVVDAARSLCPRCQTPGFVARSVRAGLPCEDCGVPTKIIAADIADCRRCGHTCVVPRSSTHAAARWCNVCNP